MERIEFKMDIQISDFRNMLMYLYLKSWKGKLYLFSFGVTILLLFVLTPFFQGTAFDYIAVIVFLFSVCALTLPFAGIFKLAKSTVKHINRARERVYEISSTGYSTRSDEGNMFIKWEKFKNIEETKKYFFLELKEGGPVVIFKYLIQPNVITNIRQILSQISIDKKLIIEEK